MDAIPLTSGKDPPVKIFISHAKVDGALLGEALQSYLHSESRLHTFFDKNSIQLGEDFDGAIRDEVGDSAVLVVLTDAFAGREWCRIEVLEAKSKGVPIVVLNAVHQGEIRSMPYLGNIPAICCPIPYGRLNKAIADQAIKSYGFQAVAKLLDETLRHLAWRASSDRLLDLAGSNDTRLMARSPELLTVLAHTHVKHIVYPDPPLGNAERKVISSLLGTTELSTPSELLIRNSLRVTP